MAYNSTYEGGILIKVFSSEFFKKDTFVSSEQVFSYAKASELTTMHVCYNVNDPFISIMGASIVSVLENNRDCQFVFHVFTDGISETNTGMLETLAKQYKTCIKLYLLDMTPFEDFHIKVARFSRITYARIAMPIVLAGEAPRFIYVDADAICVNSLQELWHWAMNGAAMGAVSEIPESVKRRGGYLKLKSGKYFNDGIMLVDVVEWNKQQITQQAFAYQKEPKERFLGQSQDVLNLVFDGKNTFLPQKYNLYGGGELALDDAVFIHWTGRRKPWQMVLSDYDALWRKYNHLSPWPDITHVDPIKEPKNYHDFKQWGLYQKRIGNYGGLAKGLFWYSVLRLRYKSRRKK